MLLQIKPFKLALLISVSIFLLTGSAAKETFGDSNTGSLPEIQNISVYNVTEMTENERDKGGELVASGLNQTFWINQTRDRIDYRLTFEIENNGPEYWNLSSEDELFHEGLDTGWNINRTWYNISGTQYEGGGFSGGRVDWDTGIGGNLSPGGSMYANYIVEVDLTESQQYNQRFLVNDTSNESGSEDNHALDLDRLGEISLTLEEPPADTVLTQNKTFEINTTVNCINGECGNVTATSRYNQSNLADTLIPEGSGSPFYTTGDNSKECVNLVSGESCTVLWDVNATGESGSHHLLDSNASSSYSEISGENTGDAEVQINQVAAINLTWSTVDFGTLDPGEKNKSAAGNQNLEYNISIPENSNSVDIWVKGQDLQSQDSDYTIPIVNMSYSLQNDTADESSIPYAYELVKETVSSGSILNSFYWLDVPTGIYKGTYSGSITFKANLTG
jgi:hypothetical protein